MLITGETFYGLTFNPDSLWAGERGKIPPAAMPAVNYPHADPALHELPTDTADDVQAYAYVNGGRWMVRCPFCPSAQLAFHTDHRFLCAGLDGCGNRACGAKYVPVVWPSDGVRARIASLLSARPTVNRNWSPEERVATLEAENLGHGV